MKLEFENDINDIISEISLLNGNLNNKNQEILGDNEKKKKIIVGNTYALEQFNRHQNYLTYKRSIKKNPDGLNTETKYNILESNDILETYIEENDYKKPWNKLDKYQKKIKITEYIDNLINDNKLKKELKNKLIKDIIDTINIKKSFKIDYDKDNKIITDIKLLKILDDKTYEISS